jgi:DNA gyrase subunit B
MVQCVFPLAVTAFQFCKERGEVIRAYANDRHCCYGGTHVAGVRTGLTRSLKEFIATNSRCIDGPSKWSTKDNGLTAVISIRLQSPQFGGATKDRLLSPEIEHILAAVIKTEMTHFLAANPGATEAIIRADPGE